MSLELEPLLTKWNGDNRNYVKMLRHSVAETKKAVKQINAEIARIKPMPSRRRGGGLGAGGAFIPGHKAKGGKGGAGAMGFMSGGGMGGGMGGGLGLLGGGMGGGLLDSAGGIYDLIQASPKAQQSLGKLGKSVWNVRRNLTVLAKTGGWAKSSLTSFGATAGKVGITLGGIATAAVTATAGIIYFYERWSKESKNAAKIVEQTQKGTEKWLELFQGSNKDRMNAISDNRRFGGSAMGEIDELKAFRDDMARTMENAEDQAREMRLQVERSKESWLGWAGIDFGSHDTGTAAAADAQRRAEVSLVQKQALDREIELKTKELAAQRKAIIEGAERGLADRSALADMNLADEKQFSINRQIYELKKQLEPLGKQLTADAEKRVRALAQQAEYMEKQVKYRDMLQSAATSIFDEGSRLGMQVQAGKERWSDSKLREEQAIFDLRLQMIDQGLELSKLDEYRVRDLISYNEQLNKELHMMEQIKQAREDMASEAADLLNSQMSDLGRLKEQIARVNELMRHGALTREEASGIIGNMKQEFASGFSGGMTDNSAGAAVQAGSMEAYSLTKFGKHERSIDVNIDKMLAENKEQTITQQEILQGMRNGPPRQDFEFVGIR